MRYRVLLTFTWLLSGPSLQPLKFPVQNKISKLSKFFFLKLCYFYIMKKA